MPLDDADQEPSDDLVTVATFLYAHEAELGRLHLEEAGIRGYVADAETVAMDWLIGTAVGHVKLQVAQSDADTAIEVLTRFPRSTSPPQAEDRDSESACLSCGAPLGEEEIRCPKCGWSYGSDETGITEEPPAR